MTLEELLASLKKKDICFKDGMLCFSESALLTMRDAVKAEQSKTDQANRLLDLLEWCYAKFMYEKTMTLLESQR